MELIINLWKNFKTQPEIWFFYGFLLTFTLTIRKVLWLLPLRGEFNEYTGAYLYLSDIFLGLTIAAWIIIILYNKIDILSMLKSAPLQKKCSNSQELFHVEQSTGQAWNILQGKRRTLICILLPLLLVVWSFISLLWAENKIVAIFRTVKILEFYLLYIFVLVRLFFWNVPRPPRIDEQSLRVEAGGTILNKIFGLIMFIGLFQAIIGIIQFILQHSIGLFWLKESLISPDIAGVAKIIFNGEAFIRAYGLFPHPNILGGFLMFSILVSLLYYKMFHSSRNVPPAYRQAGMEQFLATGQVRNILCGKYRSIIFKLILGIQLLALILTFSKSAAMGLIFGLFYYAYKNVPCGTFVGFLKEKKRLIMAVGLIIVFAFIIAKQDLYPFLFKSLDERSIYVNVSRGTILGNPILGIGSGQFVISMENLSVIKENWMLQPVHNVFLLVWSELGLIGLFILGMFLFYVFRDVPFQKQKKCSTWNISLLRDERGTNNRTSVEQTMGQAWNNSDIAKTFGAIFIGLLFVMFFDHYLWDIQQGSFLLWMTLGFLVGAGETGLEFYSEVQHHRFQILTFFQFFS